MTDRIIQISHGWPRSDRSAARLVVAILLSIAFHVTLLLLQFGEYGEGLPGFELPTTDRRGQLPELHIELQNATKGGPPESAASAAVASDQPVALPDIAQTTPTPVETFELVPLYEPHAEPVVDAKAIVPVAKSSIRPHRVKPKLVTSAAVNPDFKVAESESGKLEPPMTEDERPTETPVVSTEPEMPIAETPEKPASDQQEKALAEKAAADKINEEQQAVLMLAQQQAEKDLQEKLAAEKLAQAQEQKKLQDVAAEKAQRAEQEKQAKLVLAQQQAALKAEQEQKEQEQARLVAQQAEKLRQEALARQLAQAQVERAEQEKLERAKAEQENAQRARLAQQIADEQRKLAEAVKTEQLKQELVRKEQQERDRAAQELAEKQRLEQEEKRRQEQLARESRQSELARQAQESRQRAAAQAGQDRQRERQTDLNDILGSASDANTSAGVGAGAGNTNLDKLLSGRSADFDKNGEAVKTGAGTIVTPPKFETNSGARRSIFGSKNGDIDLNLYIQSWRQKVERNGRLNYAQSAKDKAFSDPIVTVSIRRDGTVENILILRSSGNKEIDEAVRRITILNAPYSVFPPSLARKYDVIDIRQIWIFDEGLRIADEMR